MSRDIKTCDRLTIDRMKDFPRVFSFQQIDNIFCSCYCHRTVPDLWNQMKEVHLKRADFIFIADKNCFKSLLRYVKLTSYWCTGYPWSWIIPVTNYFQMKSEHQLYFRISANLAPVMEHSLQTAWIQLQGRECCFNTVTRNILQTFGDFVYF